MTYQNKLRQEIKNLKKDNKTTYKAIAKALNIANNSFYNWLNGAYDLSLSKRQMLEKIIQNYK